MRRLVFIVAAVLPLLLSSSLRADPVLVFFLSSDKTAAQLLDLHVGDTIHVSVNLSGTMQAAQIGFLSETVDFANVLNASIPSPAEPIVPAGTLINPDPTQSDLPEFDSAAQSGSVGGTYTDFTATSSFPISTDGVFYSFNLSVTQAAAGTSGLIALGTPTATDEFFNSYATRNGEPLVYHVDDLTGVAAPLPSAATMGLTLTGALMLGAVLRKIRASRNTAV